jgi:tRNA(fMet)-specific endonuclease VapC
MGLVLDSGVLITAERNAKPVSDLLATLEQEHGEIEIVISSITVIELEHGLHRANTPDRAAKRRAYLDTIFAAVPVEPFTKEMGQIAAKIDAEAKQAGLSIPFEDLLMIPNLIVVEV